MPEAEAEAADAPQADTMSPHTQTQTQTHTQTQTQLSIENPVSHEAEDTQSQKKPKLKEKEKEKSNTKRGASFWLVILGINVSSFLAFFEATAIVNALPSIVDDLHGVDFVWVGAAYNLAASAFMPSTGALAKVFGRKAVLLSSLLIFSIGSAICGAAQSLGMLIGGRVIQGIGGAGILSSSTIIVSDIVPLSERGVFNGILQISWCIASGIGPIVSGTLAQQGQWRWIFYLNLPIAPIAAALVMAFLHLKIPRQSFRENVLQLDWIGNLIVISGASAFTIGLVWGGVTFPWHSPHVLAPLCVGGLALVVFVFYEYGYSPRPLVPVKLMLNRTTSSGFLQVAIFPIPFLAFIYYLPIYFQACRGSSPIRSGVLMFGVAFSTPPVAVLSGLIVTLTKRYRGQLLAGWALVVLGMALLGTTRAETPLGRVVGYEFVAGVGFGVVFSTTYFPVLAPLALPSVPQALAFFAFLRQFTQILGISIGGTILQNQLAQKLPSSFYTQFPEGGQAISVVPQLASSLPPAELAQVRTAFAESLGALWYIMAGIAGAGLLVALFMEHHKLQTKTDEKWGVKEKKEESEKEKEEERENEANEANGEEETRIPEP